MSRITAPVSKIVRTIGSAPAIRASSAAAVVESHHGSVLSPKYAELLSNRNTEHHHDARNLTTTHRPTPQPSIENRSKPLMQSFSSIAHTTTTPSDNIDASVLPNFHNPDLGATDMPRMPLLPDNYHTAHAPFTTTASLGKSSATVTNIVAADPEKVAPAGLSQLSGIGLDGVDVKFAHGEEGDASSWIKGQNEGGMLKDIWAGMVDDVFGAKKTAA